MALSLEKAQTRAKTIIKLPLVSQLAEVTGVGEEETSLILANLGFDPERIAATGLGEASIERLSLDDLRLRVKMAGIVVSA